MPSCQALYDNDPDAKSGPYWLMIDGIKFKTRCFFDLTKQKGWTLVAKINGKGYHFSPVSNIWSDKSVILPDDISDNDLLNTSKSHSWFLLKSNSLRLCIDGANLHCAEFTHNLGISLYSLFDKQFGITVEEKWTFNKLLSAFGKSCQSSKIKTQWCGLNMADICHPQDMNPNLNPTNHIVRIGCIASEDDNCEPGDYALGVGVTSCYDGYGCEELGPNTPNLHWACKPFYGTFDKTAFLYTWCYIIKTKSIEEDSIKIPLGGWTLVARAQGKTNEWSPISELWTSSDLLNEDTSYDISSTTSMKNEAFNKLIHTKILVCYQGYDEACAPFTHNKNVTFSYLMNNEFGVVPDEQYSFASLMKAFQKSCDVSALRQSWCGLNLANICDTHNQSPNDKPPRTTHIVRIGCIGDKTASCFPNDYAIGIGVTSCKDGYGCHNVGASNNLHYRCDYVYGYFSQTAYIYVN